MPGGGCARAVLGGFTLDLSAAGCGVVFWVWMVYNGWTVTKGCCDGFD